MKTNIVKFDNFINPNGNLERFKNKKININDIYNCSYVIYFILEHINGEITNNYFILENDNKNELEKYYFSCYSIWAINIINKIVCEVI